MLTRIISALIGAPLFVLLIYFGGIYTMFLVASLTLLCLREFLLMGKNLELRPWPILTVGISIAWLAAVFFSGTEWLMGILVLWLLISLSKLALTYPKTSLAEMNFNIAAVLYAVVLLSHLYLLCQLQDGTKWVLLTVLLVWSADTGAYFTGRLIGKHLLAPKVSPKKTVEGSLGGVAFCLAAALIFWYLLGEDPWFVYVILALIVNISAQIGDLFESALKRSAGVKDSGKLIPGHGGVLDRFDSLIFAVPLMYYGLKVLLY